MNLNSINPRKITIFFFNFLLLSVPIYFRFVNEELFEFNKMILVYAFTVMIVFFWTARMIQEKRLVFKKTPLDIPIFLFFVSQLVSTIFSIHPRTSMLGYYSRFNGGLLSTISYVLLYYAFVSNVKRKDLSGILISTFTSGIIVSIYGILEHFGHSISCLFVPGIKDFSVSCWKQDVQSRVFATFGQPNWLAAYAITIFPLSLVLAIQKKHGVYQKIFFATSSLLLMAVLIFTRSRSGIIGLAGGGFVFFIGLILIFLRNKKELISKVDIKLTGIITTALLLIIIIFGTPITPSFSELVGKINQQQLEQVQADNQVVVNRLEVGGTDSGEIRKIVWKGGLDIWKRYPIIGSGVETFAYSYYLDRPREHNDVSEWDFLYNKAHNELINLLANSGIFGLATYLSIFAVFGILVIKTIYSNQKETTKLISISILSGIVSLFISNFFGFSTVMVNVLMFILFGIFVILNQEKSKLSKKESKREISKINSFDQYFALGLIFIFMMIFLVKIYNYWEADKLFSQGKNYFDSGELLSGIQKQVEAIEKSPNEALYYDNLSDNYAKLAVELAKAGDTTNSAAFTSEAIKTSNLAMEKNNRHLNFYKTRSRLFVTLAQIDEKYLDDAQITLEKAIELAPTDPKLVYTQAVIDLSTGNNEIGKQLLEKTLELKPDYEKARWKMAEIYQENGEVEKAIEQLQYILDYISPNNIEAIDKISELKKL